MFVVAISYQHSATVSTAQYGLSPHDKLGGPMRQLNSRRFCSCGKKKRFWTLTILLHTNYGHWIFARSFFCMFQKVQLRQRPSNKWRLFCCWQNQKTIRWITWNKEERNLGVPHEASDWSFMTTEHIDACILCVIPYTDSSAKINTTIDFSLY